MATVLEKEISRLTKRQKLVLADRLLADAGLHAKPPGIMSENDPGLEAELNRRLADRRPGAWLTLEEFRTQTRLR
ncbi:MAG: hypothetical protein HZA93_23275 [Verrucomicrobia bacterium]|nr:hypothetical protein [Verrucomicrobiota bacterium]